MRDIDYDKLKNDIHKYTGSNGHCILDLEHVNARDASVEDWKDDVIEYLIGFYSNFRVFAMNPTGESVQFGNKEMLLRMIEFIDKS